MIAAVILAAGESRRMGTPKLLLGLTGQSLICHVLASARASRCAEILVVLGAEAERIGREAQGAGVRLVMNPRYREGMGTSLAAGIAALPPECEAAVVLLGDQPSVDPGSINALIDAYRRTGKPIVASRYGNVTGAPTLIGRALFPEVAQLRGDAGGRFLIRQHPDLVEEVALPDAASRDVDTPEDFVRLTEAAKEGPPPAGSS